MLKFEVIATFKATGNKVRYIYEGDGEHKGKFENVIDRINRHFRKESIKSYEVNII